MKELFIINDYDTHEPFEYIITDNLLKCKEILGNVEKQMVEGECDYWYEKFFEELDKEKVNYTRVVDTLMYDF